MAKGSWCGAYLRQDMVPYKTAPRGDKECPNACSGWGNCNHDTGLCECPAGGWRVVGGRRWVVGWVLEPSGVAWRGVPGFGLGARGLGVRVL